ncbi:MAG: DUF4169 family protein [Hyphomicrobiaceae bacterium]
MTSNVINLRQARKQRARDERRKQADENRERHGLTRAAREKKAREAEAQSRRLDGHWLSQTDADPGPATGGETGGRIGPSTDPDKG